MSSSSVKPPSAMLSRKTWLDPLFPIRHWIDHIEIQDSTFAHRVARLVPSDCPFERDINVMGRTLLHIPPLCKLNPLYDQLVGLRFRSLCYLADTCGEDIQTYL